MSLADVEGLTIQDLEAMPHDGRRYELVGGTIVVNAAPAPRHQRVSGRLLRILAESCPPGHEVFHSPIDLDLVGEQRVEPDLVVAPVGSIGEKRLVLPVLLVVELLSPSTVGWDTVTKRQAYAESNIPHYWMVDTRAGHESFTALRLPDGGVEYELTFSSSTDLVVEDPIRVSVPVAQLFQPAR